MDARRSHTTCPCRTSTRGCCVSSGGPSTTTPLSPVPSRKRQRRQRHVAATTTIRSLMRTTIARQSHPATRSVTSSSPSTRRVAPARARARARRLSTSPRTRLRTTTTGSSPTTASARALGTSLRASSCRTCAWVARVRRHRRWHCVGRRCGREGQRQERRRARPVALHLPSRSPSRRRPQAQRDPRLQTAAGSSPHQVSLKRHLTAHHTAMTTATAGTRRMAPSVGAPPCVLPLLRPRRVRGRVDRRPSST